MGSQQGFGIRLAVALGVLAGLGGSPPLAAQEPGAPVAASQRTIRVSGMGEARARPDAARLTFAVETFAPTAREAGQQNAATMEQVVAALVAAGVPRSDVETSNYTVFPEYVHDPAQPQAERIRGYRATNQVTLRTTQLPRVGELIDTALGAGANRVDGVMFELRDADAAQAEATRNAVERARATAQTMASALGVRLGPVLDASTGVGPIMPRPMPMARMQAMDVAATSTPIEPGEQTIRADVTLIFAIEGG